MDAIKKVSYANENKKVVVVWVEFESGRTATLQIREVNGKRKIFSHSAEISQDEIADVKKLAKRNGEWVNFGYAERKSPEELAAMVRSGEYAYTYDTDGMISGCTVIKNTESDLFGSMYRDQG